MKYGLKVSKSGKDVETASLADLNFTSEENLFKIKKSGTWQITLQHTYYYDDYWEEWFHDWEGEATITHNLGYIPTFEIWGQKPRESSDDYFKWFYVREFHWAISRMITVFTTSNILEIYYYETTREDLYETPNRTTLNGIYSFYVDPMLD